MNVETTMRHELSVSVYSVITQRAEFEADPTDGPVGEQRRLQAYLYDHTTIVESHGNDNYVYTIVKTTAVDCYNRAPGAVIDQAFYLANYQLDRLGSGLIGGILAGSYDEAQALLADAVVNS